MNKQTYNASKNFLTKFPTTKIPLKSKGKVVEIEIATIPTIPSKKSVKKTKAINTKVVKTKSSKKVVASVKNINVKTSTKSKKISFASETKLPTQKLATSTAKKLAKTINENIEKINKSKVSKQKITLKAKKLPVIKKINALGKVVLSKKITFSDGYGDLGDDVSVSLSLTKAEGEFTDQLADNIVLKYREKARKLARSILRKWRSRLDLEEVDSVVDLSLCEAVKRYDASKGASFMTFMFYHLRGNLIRTVSTAANSNILPILDQESTSGDGEGSHSSWMNRGIVRGVSATEIAEALTGGEREQPDNHLLRKELAELSRKACGKLDELEREVVRRIYEQEEQLLDIAHTLGYSRCHISRVKRRALECLFDELKVPLDIDKNFRPAFEDEDMPQARKYKVKRARRRRDLTDFLPGAEVI